MTYRNTRSGAVIESESRITGEFWEEIPGAPVPRRNTEARPAEDDDGEATRGKKRRNKE